MFHCITVKHVLLYLFKLRAVEFESPVEEISQKKGASVRNLKQPEKQLN